MWSYEFRPSSSILCFGRSHFRSTGHLMTSTRRRHLAFWQKSLPVRAAILGRVLREFCPDPPSCVLAAAGAGRFRHLQPGPPSWALPTLICGRLRPLGSGDCYCPSRTDKHAHTYMRSHHSPAGCPRFGLCHEFVAHETQKQLPINNMVTARLFCAYKSFISHRHHKGLQNL